MLLTRTHQTTSVIMSFVNINKIGDDDLLMTIPDVVGKNGQVYKRVLVLTGDYAGAKAVLGDREVQAASNLEEKVKEIEDKGMKAWEKYLKREWKNSDKEGVIGEKFPSAQKKEESAGLFSRVTNIFRSSSTDPTPATPPNTSEMEQVAPGAAAPATAPAEPVVAKDFDNWNATEDQVKAKAEEIGITFAKKLDKKALKILRAKVGLAQTLLASDTSLGIMNGTQDAYSDADKSNYVGKIMVGTIVVCLGQETEKFCRLITVDDRKNNGLFEGLTLGRNGKNPFAQKNALFIEKSGYTGPYVKHDLSEEEKKTAWRVLFRGNVGVNKWLAATRGEVYPAAASGSAAAATQEPTPAASGFTVGEVVQVRNSSNDNLRYNGRKYKIIEITDGKAAVKSTTTNEKPFRVALGRLVKTETAAAEEPAAEDPESKPEAKPEEGGGGFNLGGAVNGLLSGVGGAVAAVGNTVASAAGTAAQNTLSAATAGAVSPPAAQGVTSDNNLVEIKAYAKSIGVKVADVQGNKRWKKSWLKAIEEKQAGGGAAPAAAAGAPPSPDQAAAALAATTGGGESKSNSTGYGIGNKVIIAKKDGTANAWVYQITGVNADGTYKVKRVTKDGLGKNETKAATVLRRASSNVVAEYLQDDFLHLEHYKGEQEWEMEGMSEGMMDE